MPQYACGCWLEIYRPRKGARCSARWPSLCSLHAEDGPDELMQAAAEELAERGKVSAPPPLPLRPCERCSEPLPDGSHPTRRYCPPCQQAVKLEQVRSYTAQKRASDPAWRERQRQRAREYEAARRA